MPCELASSVLDRAKMVLTVRSSNAYITEYIHCFHPNRFSFPAHIRAAMSSGQFPVLRPPMIVQPFRTVPNEIKYRSNASPSRLVGLLLLPSPLSFHFIFTLIIRYVMVCCIRATLPRSSSSILPPPRSYSECGAWMQLTQGGSTLLMQAFLAARARGWGEWAFAPGVCV